LPLLLLLRNRLKLALTYKEAKAILMQRHLKVDGKVRTDVKYPAGFMGERGKGAGLWCVCM
jgi:small subunit ribosomal protein S4e